MREDKWIQYTCHEPMEIHSNIKSNYYNERKTGRTIGEYRP